MEVVAVAPRRRTAASLFCCIQLLLLTGVCLAGNLQLNPNLKRAIRLAGSDNSFFIACIPHSPERQEGVDSREWAKGLSWNRELPEGGWEKVDSDRKERIHVEGSADGQGIELVFRSISPGDSGNYSCGATLEGEAERVEFELKVIEPISFEPSNERQSVAEGTPAFTLMCDVEGDPKPKVSWNVRGSVIRGGSAKYDISPRGLIIKNVTVDDGGSYKCKATQSGYGITDFRDLVIRLKIEHKPQWPPEEQGKFYGFISGVTNLTCEAKAEPSAEFSWMDKYNEVVKEGTVVNEAHRSVLMLPISHDDVFGDYTCVARNQLGSLRKVVTLAEGAKPGVPHVTVENIDQESADLVIERNKAEMFLKIVGFRVEVKEKELATSWENATVINFPSESEGGGDHYKVSGLQAKTVYHIRVRARNLAGYSDYSNLIFLHTKSAHMVGELLSGDVATTTNQGGPVSSSSSAVRCGIAVILEYFFASLLMLRWSKL